MLLRHTEVDVMMQSVADGYYAIMAMHSPAPLGTAMSVLDRAVVQLRQEMG
jgi:hypothetical protein